MDVLHEQRVLQADFSRELMEKSKRTPKSRGQMPKSGIRSRIGILNQTDSYTKVARISEIMEKPWEILSKKLSKFY